MGKVVTTKKKIDFTPFILLSPAIILIMCLFIYPIFRAIDLSFKYYVVFDIKNSKYIGLENFIKAWEDPAFIRSLSNSVQWVLGILSMQLVSGLILALILNRKFRGRGFIRSISLIPWATPGVLIGLMWAWIFNGNYGVINDIFLRIGLINQKIAWLSNPATALKSQMVALIWQGIPFFMLMILASLQTVSLDLYEAAEVSGASSLQKFIYITFPHITPTLLITILIRIIWIFNNVEIIYIMTGGGPGYSSLTLPVYIYIVAQKTMNFGYGAALSIYGSIVLLTVMIVYVKLANKWGGLIDR
jgi:multiple sugar transport system permease protein